MKAIISSTFDEKYHYFIPLVVWCWKKLGVEVTCFVPYLNFPMVTDEDKKWVQITGLTNHFTKNSGVQFYGVSALEHKMATYMQCARLYAGCLDLPLEEILITGDVDMLVFGNYLKQKQGQFDIFGKDLVPENQLPICFISATVNDWRIAMKLQYGDLSQNPETSYDNIHTKTYQQCLDETVGTIECTNFKGNQWSLDQDTAYKLIIAAPVSKYYHGRAKEGTQFSTRRYDRDDAYLLDRLSLDTIDFHLPRPGYEDKNFEIILKVLQFHYPYEDFTWLIEYTEAYKKLL